MTTRSPRLNDDWLTVSLPSRKVVLAVRAYVVDVPAGPSTTIEVLDNAVTMPERVDHSLKG
jgi:hypothetical protein